MKGFEGGVTAGEGSRTMEELERRLRMGLGMEAGARNRDSAEGIGVVLRCRIGGGGVETEVHEFANTVKLINSVAD